MAGLTLDPLGYATPDLDDSVAWPRGQGVALAPGGAQVGLGTRDYLLGQTLDVAAGTEPGLDAVLRTAVGAVVLR